MLIGAADRASTAAPPATKSAHEHHAQPASPAKPGAATTASRSAAGSAAAARGDAKATSTDAAFTGNRAETEQLIAYDNAITLTPQQEAVRVEALTPLAAPCCKQFSAATCCCRCNMKRASDGLAKHLIADLGFDALTVRAQVSAWQKAINPNGWSGDTCSTGGCGRPFAQNGCGGMTPGQLVF